MSRASGGRTVRTVRTGSFTANAVEDRVEVSIGDVQTRVSNWCFGVSMTGTLKGACKAVNPLETTQCVSTCQDVSERVRAIGRRRQRLVETTLEVSGEVRRRTDREHPGIGGRGHCER